MMTQLSWSALIFAALAAVACSNHNDEPACDVDLPVFGSRTCCERHKPRGESAAHFESVEAAWRSRADTAALH
jgi:hypothetical protein